LDRVKTRNVFGIDYLHVAFQGLSEDVWVSKPLKCRKVECVLDKSAHKLCSQAAGVLHGGLGEVNV
jgi:hypothetical protein